MPRYLDTIPHPWTRAAIETAIFTSFTDARAAIDDTLGGELWRSLQELEDSVWILQVNITELLDEIALFADRSKSPTFWQEAGGSAADMHTRAVKRKLINCTASVMSLVDHARNFEGRTPVPCYVDQVKKHFSPPGLHDFLRGLRNYNSHWRIAQANWTISSGREPNSRQASFIVTKDELLAWSGWTQDAKQFISTKEESVDVYELFSTYREHVQAFYAWHRGAVLTHYATQLQTYLGYKRIYEGLSKKYNWNMIISHLPKALNPYQHLSRYLPANAVESWRCPIVQDSRSTR